MLTSWEKARLRELAKMPPPKPTKYALERAAHHQRGSVTLPNGTVIRLD